MNNIDKNIIQEFSDMFIWMDKEIREVLYFSKINSSLNDKIYSPIEKFEKKLINLQDKFALSESSEVKE